MTTNREVVVTELPSGVLGENNFSVRTGPIPAVADGHVLVRTLLMSIDAANRAWMQGATYREAIHPGDVMHTYSIAEVMASDDARFSEGEIVAVEAGWADYCNVLPERIQKVKRRNPLSTLLSVYGVAGKTAYHGLLGVGKPVSGETVLISAAAGSVGIYVGQIAKTLGLKVVGIAGGSEKCDWLKSELGFDDCIDYRQGNLFKSIKGACSDGVDIYFDNVGGTILETALFHMNERGRVVCCGAVSQYQSQAPIGPRNLPGLVVVKRLRMEGFIVFDFADQDEKAEKDLESWVEKGQIKIVEDVVEGLENAPSALIGLLSGNNRGKRMVRVAPDPP